MVVDAPAPMNTIHIMAAPDTLSITSGKHTRHDGLNNVLVVALGADGIDALGDLRAHLLLGLLDANIRRILHNCSMSVAALEYESVSSATARQETNRLRHRKTNRR